jgi:cobalt-zinc-cadmium efflux system outer membrane protein
VGARVSPLLNPYLEVVAERGGRGVTRDLAFTAQLHTPIEIGGQRSRRINEADSFVEWRTASLEQLRAQILGATVRSYGECIAYAARLDTLDELLQSARAEASVLVSRRDAGDATERDTQLAEVERARVESQLKEVQASLNSALNELGRLTGRRFTAVDTAELFPKVTMNVPGNQQVPSAPAVLGAQAEARFYGRVDERLARERIPPLSVILQAGRGDLTETRLGAGLAWSLPAFRYNQGERAKAQAEAERARATAATYSRSIAQRLRAIAEEDRLLRVAVDELDRDAIPAATLATDSATRMQRAGKTDLLSVIVARRDLYLLKLRRLEIAQRSWQLLGDWVGLTGKVPR